MSRQKNSHLYNCLAILFSFTACGSSLSVENLSGTWTGQFKNGSGQFELLEKSDGMLAGTLTIGSALWPVTGITAQRPQFSLIVLPSNDEQILFDTLGFQKNDAVAEKWSPLHAEDKFTFTATVNANGKTAEGIVSAKLTSNETTFTMQR